MKQHGHSRDPGETGVVLGQVGAAGGERSGHVVSMHFKLE